MRWLHQIQNMSMADATAALIRAHPGCGGALPTMVAIVGASHLGANVAADCSAHGVKMAGIFDDAPSRHGATICGLTVQPTSALCDVAREVPVVLATHRLAALNSRLRDLGFVHRWPFALLALRWPAQFRTHPFYDGLHVDLLANAKRLSSLAAMLADDTSRESLDAIIGFRLHLDVEMLSSHVQSNAYFSKQILTLGSNEVYVDGGAYSGDTIAAFLQATAGAYQRIVAIEPSLAPFSALSQRFQHTASIRCLRACLYSETGRLRFDNTNARDSSISATQGDFCDTLRIDDLPEADETSFIKLNIEGSEEDALHGARHTLVCHAPRLAVAAYHRPKDLWLLAQLLHDMQPDFRFYLRQHDGGIVETVLYATQCPRNPSQA